MLENGAFTCSHESVQVQQSESGWIGNYKPSDTIENDEKFC